MSYIYVLGAPMIAENLDKMTMRIAAACARSGRSAHEITLIAVTKTFGTDQIREAMDAGVLDFGENYVQELQRKRSELPGEQIRWHFIGHLQSNKIKQIIGWVEAIHAVDSVHLGEEISKQASQLNRAVKILVEVNTTGEKSKFGVSPDGAALLVEKLLQVPNVNVAGLMTIGPFLSDPEGSRPAFRQLKKLRDSIEKSCSVSLPQLSMGMSHDFEVAIEEGATMVRLGTAIFGARPKPAGNQG